MNYISIIREQPFELKGTDTYNMNYISIIREQPFEFYGWAQGQEVFKIVRTGLHNKSFPGPTLLKQRIERKKGRKI